jgi:hypothetical protein
MFLPMSSRSAKKARDVLVRREYCGMDIVAERPGFADRDEAGATSNV